MPLPPEVLAKAEFSPVEDIALAILRAALPGVEVNSLIRHDQAFPFVLVRGGDALGEWRGDHRFLDSAQLLVHTFASDPDGDEDAALLAEAVRVALRDAWRAQTIVPGRGHITGFDMVSKPRRVTDWATATGPVQYADLPAGTHRYEVRFGLTIRKPKTLAL